MTKHKFTTRELNALFSMAKEELINTPSRGLENHENLARCWIVSVNRLLNLGLELHFPTQHIIEPDED